MNLESTQAPEAGISNRSKIIFVLKIIFYLLLIAVLFFLTNIYQTNKGDIEVSIQQENATPLQNNTESETQNLQDGISTSETSNFIIHFVEAVLFFFTGHLVVTTSRLILIGIYNRRNRQKRSENFVVGINQVSIVISVFIFFLAVLLLFDITITQLFASIGFAAAAFAILFKDYISNMINGLIIMFNNQVTIGDFVKIGNQKGQITDIKLMNMQLINEDEELVLIPNIAFFNSEMINYSKQAIPKVIVEFQVAHTFGNKLTELKNHIVENLKEYQQYIIDDSYALKIIRIGKDQLDLKFQVVLHADNDPVEKQIKRKVPFIVAEFISNSG